MISKPWSHFTSPAQDRFIGGLDLTDASLKEIDQIMQAIAEGAYEQGYKDREEEEE